MLNAPAGGADAVCIVGAVFIGLIILELPGVIYIFKTACDGVARSHHGGALRIPRRFHGSAIRVCHA
jgi:hypothetical protein